MSINLQTLTLPRRGSLNLNRKVRHTRRKMRSTYNAWYRRQYFLTNAHQDVKAATARNEDIVFGIALIATMLTYGYSAIMAQLLIDILETIYAITEISSLSFTLLLAVTVGVLSVTTAWVAAFICNALSLGIMQGINRKQNRSIRLTLRQALSKTTQTVLAWTHVIKELALPVIVAGLFGIIFIVTVPFHNNYWLLSIPAIVGLIGLGVAIKRLAYNALVPFAMLFEDLEVADAFARSRELVAVKGRLFLASVFASLIVALTAMYGVAVLINKLTTLPSGLTFSCAAIATLLYTNAILTVFYSKRRRSRI